MCIEFYSIPHGIQKITLLIKDHHLLLKESQKFSLTQESTFVLRKIYVIIPIDLKVIVFGRTWITWGRAEVCTEVIGHGKINRHVTIFPASQLTIIN